MLAAYRDLTSQSALSVDGSKRTAVGVEVDHVHLGEIVVLQGADLVGRHA